MMCAAQLAARTGRIDSSLVERQHQLLTGLKLPTTPPADLDVGELVHLMRHDKKTTAGRLRFVLPTRMGHVELVDGIDSGNNLVHVEGPPEIDLLLGQRAHASRRALESEHDVAL